MFLQRLSPGTLRAYAACLEHRRDLGELPEPAYVAKLAAQEGASPTAVLVLARWELLDAQGQVVPLNGFRHVWPPAVVPDAETAWAILTVGRHPFVRLTSPRGTDILASALPMWADRRRR